MKKILREKKTMFDQYRAGLEEDERLLLDAFLMDMDRHIALDREDSLAMKLDFETAVLYYSETGLPLEETLKRLDVANLGGFYARPPISWFPLDDAAKLYPLSMKHGQMAMFRLSAYLKEDVVPEILQMALTFTIKRFPSFATTVKKGFFWHYLDTSKKRYALEEERDIPCKPMNISHSGSQSFRVLYYGKRISAEFFHILTDGTGGMMFLKALLKEYLRLLGKLSDGNGNPSEQSCLSDWEQFGIPDINRMPIGSEFKAFLPESGEDVKWSGFVDKPAVQFSGKLSKLKICQIIHLKLDSEALVRAAHERNVTVTAYVLTQLFTAGRYATDEYNGDMNIQVPVNLRKYYPSPTMRNFFMCCGIRIPLEKIENEEGLFEEVSAQLAEKGSRKSMGVMMDATRKLVKAVAYIPLSVKAPVARIAYGFLGDRVYSNTFSNLGVVNLPPEMEEHVAGLDFILGTAITNRACCTLVTLGNTSTLTVAKLTEDPSFEEKLAELFEQRGILKGIEGSELYETRK